MREKKATLEKEDVREDNVIHVDFGAPRAPAVEPDTPPYYDVGTFDPDALAFKKLEIFTEFVDAGMVSVTLDASAQGVCVPPQFEGRPELVLNFSHRFYIEDFTYDEHAICASLSFSGTPFYCVVPWKAVKILLCHDDNRVAVFDASLI
jgi:hypothetical protein